MGVADCSTIIVPRSTTIYISIHVAGCWLLLLCLMRGGGGRARAGASSRIIANSLLNSHHTHSLAHTHISNKLHTNTCVSRTTAHSTHHYQEYRSSITMSGRCVSHDIGSAARAPSNSIRFAVRRSDAILSYLVRGRFVLEQTGTTCSCRRRRCVLRVSGVLCIRAERRMLLPMRAGALLCVRQSNPAASCQTPPNQRYVVKPRNNIQLDDVSLQ